jgi:hypothetical protein
MMGQPYCVDHTVEKYLDEYKRNPHPPETEEERSERCRKSGLRILKNLRIGAVTQSEALNAWLDLLLHTCMVGDGSAVKACLHSLPAEVPRQLLDLLVSDPGRDIHCGRIMDEAKWKENLARGHRVLRLQLEQGLTGDAKP